MKKTDKRATPEKVGPSNLRATVFASFPDALIIWDRQGNMLDMNSAALKLFEVREESSWKGRSCQEFFQRCELRDEQQNPVFCAPWLLEIVHEKEAAPGVYILFTPSRRKFCLVVRCSPVLDAQRHALGVVSIFSIITPRCQKALHLQRVHEALSTLNQAIAEIPARFAFAVVDGMHLLSPPVLFVAQQLVNVIRQVLNCWRVGLVALSSPERYMYFVVGSGFTSEQQEERQAVSGRFIYSDFVDDTVYTRLHANQEVILGTDRLRIPTGYPLDLGAATLLLVPLFLEQELAGVLTIFKEGWDSGYTREEIDLVRAVAAQAMLVIECLGYLREQEGVQAREIVLYEVNWLSGEFLTLASHELRTPLTGIKGNLQLAQRRLEMLKHELVAHPETVGEHIQHAQQSLASATQSARQQERMIQDMIDDARIQANQLELFLKPIDLLALLKAVIAGQRRSTPERSIVLKILTTGRTVPVLADAGRITRVLNIYLAHALDYSPAGRPITVQLAIEGGSARVSVHNEGPGIPLEEQGRIWERFYRGKGGAVQHELDLSLGLSFYLCQALIERHHGVVGVESEPRQGTTFWFTLPLFPPGRQAGSTPGHTADSQPPRPEPESPEY